MGQVVFIFSFPFSFSTANNYLHRSDSNIIRDHPDYEQTLTKFMREVQVTGKQWQLCFRASENSYSARAFHAACDNKGPTVTLVRVGDNVFGGYTDKSWGGSVGESWSYGAPMYSEFSRIRTLYEGRGEGGGEKIHARVSRLFYLLVGLNYCDVVSHKRSSLRRIWTKHRYSPSAKRRHFPCSDPLRRPRDSLQFFCDWPLPLSVLSELAIDRNARTSTVASSNENQGSRDCPDRWFGSKYLAVSAALMTFCTSKDAFQGGHLRSSRLAEIPQRFS